MVKSVIEELAKALYAKRLEQRRIEYRSDRFYKPWEGLTEVEKRDWYAIAALARELILKEKEDETN